MCTAPGHGNRRGRHGDAKSASGPAKHLAAAAALYRGMDGGFWLEQVEAVLGPLDQLIANRAEPGRRTSPPPAPRSGVLKGTRMIMVAKGGSCAERRLRRGLRGLRSHHSSVVRGRSPSRTG